MLEGRDLSDDAEPARPSEGEVRAQLIKILRSSGFVRSERVCELLQFLAERSLGCHPDSPKESEVGVAVFGRQSGYDMQADPVVRVTARRLRAKLAQYYADAGREDPVRIELHPGRYAIEFCVQGAPGGLSSPAAQDESPAIAMAVTLPGFGGTLFDRFQAQRSRTRNLRPRTAPHGPSHPAFSPDGQAIACDWRGPGDATEHVYVQHLEAEGPARFGVSRAREVRPAWSPDGGRIAYAREVCSGRFELWTGPVLGQGGRRLAETTTVSTEPPRVDWSPDGTVVVTSGVAGAGAADALWLILVDGGLRQQITVPPSGCCGDDEAVFSPTGHMLAFRRRTGRAAGAVYLHPISSGGAARRLTWGESEICGFAWALDGESVIVSIRREADCPSLWRFPLSGAQPTRLSAAGEAATWPALSRRKGRLAYVRQSPYPYPDSHRTDMGQIMVAEDFR